MGYLSKSSVSTSGGGLCPVSVGVQFQRYSHRRKNRLADMVFVSVESTFMATAGSLVTILPRF
eukprot:9606755-Karenia_brevis.AAC.1